MVEGPVWVEAEATDSVVARLLRLPWMWPMPDRSIVPQPPLTRACLAHPEHAAPSRDRPVARTLLDRAAITVAIDEAWLDLARGTAGDLPGRPTRRNVDSSVMCAPLLCGEQVVGVLTVGRGAGREPFTQNESEQLAALAGDVGVALGAGRGGTERDAAARAEDRERIAADLHDHVIQSLFATGMGLQGMLAVLPRHEHQERISAYVDAIDTAIRRIRSTIYPREVGDRPDQVPLGEALLAVLSDETAALGFTPRIERHGPIDTIPAGLAQDILAVVREALSNTARHARAAGVVVRVGLCGTHVSVEVSDDGDGFGATTRSSGLGNLRRRAEAHNGTLELSTPSGGGADLRWTAELPLLAR